MGVFWGVLTNLVWEEVFPPFAHPNQVAIAGDVVLVLKCVYGTVMEFTLFKGAFKIWILA